MRELISIVEARPKRTTSDPAVQVQAVYDKALVVARAIAHTLMIKQWNQEWVTALRRLIAEARRRHEASEADEVNYDDAYKARPFSLDADDVTAQWWQQIVKPDAEALTWAAKAEYERYQDEHPKVEQSDRMSLHQDEMRLVKTIFYKGNDSLDGLTVILDAINDFTQSIDHHVDIDYMHVVAYETHGFIERIIPAIVAICRLRGAKVGAATTG